MPTRIERPGAESDAVVRILLRHVRPRGARVTSPGMRSRMGSITPGRYRHYKGNEYTVLGIARHSETLEELVVYRQEYGDRGLWFRPASMFAETVDVEGQTVPRFRLLEE